jgi:two-component system, OmpR family, response regulator
VSDPAAQGESVLVVDNDPPFRAFVRDLLERAGFDVVEAADGEAALSVAALHRPELVLLDVCLPRASGYEVCRELRDRFGDSLGIIFVSGERMESIDRVSGLLLGADDYLAKPFDLDELLARLRALHRRSHGTADDRPLAVGDLTVDPGSHRVTRGGTAIELSAREFDILRLLVERVGKVVTRYAILDEVWDGETDLRSNVIDVHVASLRAKIDRPFGTETITTLRGVGYRIDERR